MWYVVLAAVGILLGVRRARAWWPAIPSTIGILVPLLISADSVTSGRIGLPAILLMTGLCFASSYAGYGLVALLRAQTDHRADWRKPRANSN